MAMVLDWGAGRDALVLAVAVVIEWVVDVMAIDLRWGARVVGGGCDGYRFGLGA